MEISLVRIVIDVTCDVSDAWDIPPLPCYLEYELEELGPPKGVDLVNWYVDVVEGQWRFYACESL